MQRPWALVAWPSQGRLHRSGGQARATSHAPSRWFLAMTHARSRHAGMGVHALPTDHASRRRRATTVARWSSRLLPTETAAPWPMRLRAWLFSTMQGSSWQRSDSTSTAPPGPSCPSSRPRPPRPSAQQLEKLLWGDSGIKAILGWLGHRRRLGPAMLDASITGQSDRSCWPTSPELLFAGMGRQPGEEVHRQGRGLWMGGEARGPDVPQGGGTWLNW